MNEKHLQYKRPEAGKQDRKYVLFIFAFTK